MSRIKDIILDKPFVVNVREKMVGFLSKFETEDEFKTWFKTNFGWDKFPYEGIKRQGMDSSTDYSDIYYDEIEVGHNFYYRIHKGMQLKTIPIVITAKCNYIVFYKELTTNKVGYIDFGADSNDPNFKYHASPKSTLYPIEVKVPDYIDISGWHLPKQVVKTII